MTTFTPERIEQILEFSEGSNPSVTNGAIVIHTQRLKSDPGGNLLS
ncbi:glutathione S-transferase [Salmonella enterica subsp. enterica serovar Bovismorbificans]|nr:glutathione S-transferase [Salmonella enterica subsp. enterica serovar Bovismorbificans]